MSVPGLILEKFQTLDRCLVRIRGKVGNNFSRIDDADIQDIVTLNLQRTCQLAIDVAGIILREQRVALPATLREYFEILHTQGVLEVQTSEQLVRMVGFRNIAVHDYGKLNVDILKAIVEKHLTDFEQFQREVLSFYAGPPSPGKPTTKSTA